MSLLERLRDNRGAAEAANAWAEQKGRKTCIKCERVMTFDEAQLHHCSYVSRKHRRRTYARIKNLRRRGGLQILE